MSKGEHQEQSVHSGSLDPVNQKTIPQVQETQAPKKSKLLKKVLAVVLRRKNSIITEPPHKEAVQGVVGDAIAGESDATLSVPSAAYSFARNHANRQAQIRSRSNLVDDSDDDNASFFSAKSSGDDDFYASSILPPFAEAEVVNKASPEAPLSLTDVGTIDAARSDAAKTKLPLSISTTFYSSLSGVPGDDLDGGREVPIESGIQMEEMMDDSSSTASSSGRMPASPESSGELDTVQVASSPVTRENPAVTGGEDLVNPLAEGKDKVQPVTQEMGNHEFLQFERTLDSKTIEINVAEQAVRVSKDSPLGDVVLSHLPISGAASSLVCSEVEIVQESLHCEIQEQFTSSKINTEDIERSAAIIPRASPDSAMRLELVPLPQDKGDPTIVPETTAHSVVAEQTIRVVESQTTGHGFISQALNVGGEHAPPALPGGSPAGSVEVTQELSTSLLQEKTADVIDIQTASQGINAGSPPVHAGGESLSPRPSNEPSNATTGEPRVQEPPLSSLVQKGSPAAGPAKQVQESADGGVEMMLQQFFQMAERMSSQSGRWDGLKTYVLELTQGDCDEGDTERSPHPQTKPVNFVINVTNNHISTVAHGAGGDNYYGPIGQSAIGGQGGYNDIKNHQTKEIRMKEDQRQGIIEGERRKAVAPSNLARPRASPDGQDRERKTSAPTQSNVGIDNGRCRSGSITLDGIHVREQVSLPVTNTSSTKLPSQHTVPGIAVAAEPPSNGTTQPGSERPAIVDAARLEDPFQSKKMSHEPRPVQREQHTYSGSPRSVNRVSMDTQEAQAPKNTDRRRIPKMILAFFGKRKSPVKSTTSVPNEPTDIDTVGRAIQEEDDQHLSMPSIVHASGKLRQIEPESRSKEVNDSDDDNASFFSAKSSKDDDFYASPAASTSLPFPIADANHEFHLERSLSLTNVGAVADLPHNDAAEIRLSSSLSASVATSFGAPGIDLDGGREVLIESGIVEVIMDDSSSSVSSSGRMLASLQSSGELDTVQEASSSVTGETSLIACDEDLVSPLAEGKALIQSAIPELGNDQSLLFPRTLNSKNIEVNSARQTVGKDTPLADVGLSHLPVPGDTSRVVCTEVGIMHESSVAQEKLVIASTSINAQDAGLRMAVAANPLPDSAMRPELVPLPSDEMDLMDVPENPVHSVVLEQTIRDVESQVVVQSSIPRPDAIRVDEKSQLPPSSEDLPVGSVNSVQELATSLLQA
ncbi:hypothetical protein EYR38_009004 [Pleurotus pulmonarius]|nr:hypothetical protein EYR38_009004 [Pleurotus pulmonarius]